METTIQNTEPPIFQRIYEIRGQKVMLDFDLAELYGTETKYLKRAVNRNTERFPADFMFQLTRKELNAMMRSQIATQRLKNTENETETNLRCRFGTSSLKNTENETETNLYGGKRYLPYAFTEQGVAMLSGVINSPVAVAMNISIMRAFVALRQYALNYANLSSRLEEHIKTSDSNFSEVFDILDELTAQKKLYENRKPIGFVIREE